MEAMSSIFQTHVGWVHNTVCWNVTLHRNVHHLALLILLLLTNVGSECKTNKYQRSRDDEEQIPQITNSSFPAAIIGGAEPSILIFPFTIFISANQPCPTLLIAVTVALPKTARRFS